tara:strand:- start:170 stop:772 length:603 start_codon:yes stop_codon:yes gene_type:complete
MKGIYAILDENNFDFSSLDLYVKKMIECHVRIFQIRIKSTLSDTHISIIKKIKKLCELNNCLLILNDYPEIVKNLNLDGVHIGSNDTNLAEARNILGDNKIIGVSCYNDVDLALSAEKNGASYISFGSLFKTTTKKNPVDLDTNTIHEGKKILTIPICLIGGININNVHDAINLNCDLIAISKGLTSLELIGDISKKYYE